MLLRRLFSRTRTIDLRSDTVTLPLPQMKLVMTEASLGDDVYQEDPTINALQTRVATLFNKEAALFVPSGTMANLISVLSYCGPGDQVLLGDLSHVLYYEQGGISAVGGVMPRAVRNRADGGLDLAHLEEQVMPDKVHFPRSKLVLLENTHNNCGGTVLPLEHVAEVSAFCKPRGLKLHVDGARIMNAYVYLKKQQPDLLPSDLVKNVDSLSLCFSKGLSCPVGSVVIGSKDFIEKAHRWRKCVGGAMRQGGVLAAPALVALDMAERLLSADHENAQIFAEGLRELHCAVSPVQTNIVNFAPKIGTCAEIVRRLKEKNVLLSPKVGEREIRAVTNSTVSKADIFDALEILKTTLD